MRAILPNEANKSCIFKDNTFVTYIAAWSLLPTRDKTCRGLDPVNRIKRRQAQVERNRVPRGIHGYPSCAEPALDLMRGVRLDVSSHASPSLRGDVLLVIAYSPTS